MTPQTPTALSESVPAQPLFRTFLSVLRTADVHPIQIVAGLWSLLYSFVFFIPSASPFLTAPQAYLWMAFLPSWAWGLLWAGKGSWLILSALSSVRARNLLCTQPTSPEFLRCERSAYWSSYCCLLFSFAMAWGFSSRLGFLNSWVFTSFFLILVNSWAYRRLSVRRL